MSDSARRGNIVALCMILCMALSCTSVETSTKPEEPVPAQVKPQMTNEYQSVLNDWKAKHAKNPKNREIITNYAIAVEEMKTSADKEYEKENYALSGRIYGTLLKNYPGFKGFAKNLSFDRQELKDRLSNCKTALYQKGFEFYRNNQLNDAIQSWQGLLSIDPQNEDIRKAVNTAILQRKTLH
jgi:tetratricopeptide (TPR) repeat protein